MSTHQPIIFNTQEYWSIEEFKINSITMSTSENHPGCGNFGTSLAISPLSYRKKHKTRASVKIRPDDELYVRFCIVDDHGHTSLLYIPNYMNFWIHEITEHFKEEELLID